jgi:hypothetical protein
MSAEEFLRAFAAGGAEFVCTTGEAVSPNEVRDAIQLLDALNSAEFKPWTLVDAAWTSKQRSAVSTGNRNGG